MKLRNQKNGKSSKEMKNSIGEFELNAPRNRNATSKKFPIAIALCKTLPATKVAAPEEL
jgi:hypothetical protein